MQITITGRRLALGAVLILAGAAAPLAYATVAGTTTPVPSAVRAVPLAVASPGSAAASAAVADYPFQSLIYGSTAENGLCHAGGISEQDFVLESVTVTSLDQAEAVASSAAVNPWVKISATESVFENSALSIPLDADGDGSRAFNLVVRPASHANAAINDVRDILVCVQNATPGQVMRYLIILTGQRIASPTAALVVDFRAKPATAGATLRWSTGSERTLAGFNVWRFRNAKGVKVNRTLIRAKRGGQTAGAGYRFDDQLPRGSRGVTYRLQLIGLNGRHTWYAAFAVAG